MPASISRYAVTPLELDLLLGVPWLPAEAQAILAFVAPRSQAWMGWIGDEVVFVAGIATIYAGVGEAWSYLSPTAKAHPMFLHRAVRRGLKTALLHGNFRRVQSFACEADPAACRWLDRLGFQLEGRMRLAGPNGETMCRYAMFPKGLHGG